MTTIHEIEEAVTRLPSKEFKKFRTWFDEYDAARWDVQFERDVHDGKLDIFAEQALSEYKKDECTEL